MQEDPRNTGDIEMFLTPQEVSEALRISIYTVRRWINEGQLPAYKLGRVWRIRNTDFDTWLKQRSTPRSPETDVPPDRGPMW